MINTKQKKVIFISLRFDSKPFTAIGREPSHSFRPPIGARRMDDGGGINGEAKVLAPPAVHEEEEREPETTYDVRAQPVFRY